MSDADIKRNQELIESLKRRKHERDKQLAQLGVNADPIIRIEIADIASFIHRLEQEIITWNNSQQNTADNSKRSASNRIEYFSQVVRYLETINAKVGALTYEVYKLKQRDAVPITEIFGYNIIEMTVSDVMDVYIDFMSYYGEIRLFIPSSIDDLVREYEVTLLAGGMMRNDVVQYVNTVRPKLQRLLDDIVKAMQQHIEKYS